MKSKKILLSLFGTCMLSLFACSSTAKRNEVNNVEAKLNTVCRGDMLLKECVTKKGGKVARTINYFHEKLRDATIYYSSGRIAKTVIFDEHGQLAVLFIYPDMDKTSSNYDEKNEYDFTFKNGKFISMSNHGPLTFISINHTCIENTENTTKCNELNFFSDINDPELHPVLSIPLERQDLDVLKVNGIKFQ